TTTDFSRNPKKRAQYLEILESKYPVSSSSNLYDSFIDMRTSLFDKMSKTSKGSKKVSKEKKNMTPASRTPIARSGKSTLESKETKDQTYSIHTDKSKLTKDNDYCYTFCSTNMNKQECMNTKMVAQLACSILVKEFSEYEIEQAILGTFSTTIEDLLKQILSSKKLDYNDRVLLVIRRISQR
ncbi:unnamed protein product, partial [marine sediment metagenome]